MLHNAIENIESKHADSVNNAVILSITTAPRNYQISNPSELYINDQLSLSYLNPDAPFRYTVLFYYTNHAKDIRYIFTTSELNYKSYEHRDKKFVFFTRLNPTYSALFLYCPESKNDLSEKTWENWSEIRIVNTNKMRITSTLRISDRFATENRTAIHELNEKTFIVLCEALVSDAELKAAQVSNQQLKPVILPNALSDAKSAKKHAVLDFYVHSGKGYERQATYILDNPEPFEYYRFLKLSATRFIIMTSSGKNIVMEMSPEGMLNIQYFKKSPMPFLTLYPSIMPDIFFSTHYDSSNQFLQEWDTTNIALRQTYRFESSKFRKLLDINGSVCHFQDNTSEAKIPSLENYLYRVFSEETNLTQYLSSRNLVSLVLSYFIESLKESLSLYLRNQSLFKTPDFKAEVIPLPEPRLLRG